MMHELPSERITMESKRDALPIALIIVMIGIYALFGIFVLATMLKIIVSGAVVI